jgi:DNA-binding Lrp family transcriptional regulator
VPVIRRHGGGPTGALASRRLSAAATLLTPTRPTRPMTLDDLDRRLLALLQADARTATAVLARRLGVARTTVLARLTRLERSGVVVGYTVRLGQDEADRGVEAYVGIATEPKSARDVTQRLAVFPELRQLCSVSGEFDYMALLRADSPARLDALLDEIGAIDGVRKTTTSVLLARRIDRTTPR